MHDNGDRLSRPDDAWHAAKWAVIGAVAPGLPAAIAGSVWTVKLLGGNDLRGALAGAASAIAGALLLVGAAWLADHADHKRGRALLPVLMIQAGASLLMAWHVLSQLPRGLGPAAVLGLMAFTLASALNLRAFVLCGGPKWRVRAPEWLHSASAMVKTGFVAAAVLWFLAIPGTMHR
jgi:hypothetical protein